MSVSLRLSFFLSFVLGLCSAGCGSGGDEMACTTEARSSVTLEVVDTMGNRITDATVTYSVDGGASKNCEPFPDGTYTCGFEEAGAFSITATRGMDTHTHNLTVTSDECHVIGQNVTITLGM